MQSLPSIFLGSAVIALSGAVMPGPLFTVTVREAAREGFWVGPLLILGHAVLELALVVALVLGLAPLLNRPLFLGAVGVVGGAVLLWLAWGMLRGLPTLRLSLEVQQAATRDRGLVLDGILLSLSNPYWSLWWATVGLSYLTLTAGRGWVGAGTFFAGHILGDLSWYSLVSGTVHAGRRFLSDGRYRVLVGTCSLVLVWFGAAFLWSGAGALFGGP